MEKKINKDKERKVFILKYIIVIIAVFILGYFFIIEVVKYNEDLEAKIVGEKYSEHWSNTSSEIENSKDFEQFKYILKENENKFDKTIIIFNQFSGCGSCIDKLLENINNSNKEFEGNKLGILLVTTLDKEYIDDVYKENYKFMNIVSDSKFEISKNLDMYNEEYSQMENCILVIEQSNLEAYLDEYYYEKDEEAIEYVLSYIKNK